MKPFHFTALWLFLFVSVFEARGQGNSCKAYLPQSGPSSTQSSLWSTFSNPAGISSVQSLSAGFYHTRTWNLKALSERGISAVLPLNKAGASGFCFQQSGYELFSDSKVGLTYSRGFGNAVAAGLRGEWRRISLGEDYGSVSGWSVAAGLMIKVSPVLQFSATFNNIQQRKIQSEQNERIPAQVAMGLVYTPGPNADFAVQATKTGNSKEQFCAGINYRINRLFGICGGAGTGNEHFYFGASFAYWNVEITVASGYRELLGFSPHLALLWKRK